MTTQIKEQKLSDSTSQLFGLGGVGKRYFFQKDDDYQFIINENRAFKNSTRP